MALIDFLGGGQLKGNSTTGGVFNSIIDSVGNYISQLQRAKLATTQEGLMVMGKNDEYATFIRTDRKGNVLIGNYIPEIIENFEGATVNIQKWTPTSSTFAPTQATTTGYQHNPGASVLASAGTMLVSQRLMYKFARMPMQIKRRFRHSLVTGAVTDFGFGSPAALTTLIVPNGAMLRITSSGTLAAYLTFNGVEIATANVIAKSTLGGNTIGANLTMASLTANYYTYDLVVDDDNFIVTIQDTETGNMVGSANVPVPATALKMWGSTGLPYYERTYNTGTPASAPVVISTDIMALDLDIGTQMDADQIAGQLGMTVSANPFTGAPLTARVNSTVPGTATLSNTTAAYTQPDFGFLFAAVAGAETDYLLSAFQVPAGLKFLCTGIMVETFNQVAAVATTPTTLEWALGFNSSAASLATANSKRKQIGVQTFLVGAGIGAAANRIDANFTPEITESGRFVQVALRMPLGTATATETFRGIVSLKGRFI